MAQNNKNDKNNNKNTIFKYTDYSHIQQRIDNLDNGKIQEWKVENKEQNTIDLYMQIEINPKGYFQSIGEFKFIKDVGVGSFGKVKLAIHRGTRKQYAIKIIDLNANLSQTQLHVIARQIKVHAKLDHPHIIKLWDTLFDDNKIYMIMDYAKNGSLFKYHSLLLQQGIQPSSSQIYQFFYQTLQALKYLHNNDIMHRDIKPENLLLDQDLNVKLCDFGWATNQITMSRNTFCGTYQYMAPEMALQKSYDFRIDIWALGVLLYELVHGRAPFQAQNLKMMKQRINKGSYEINSQCSGNLKDLIVDILQFIPEKRLTIQEIQAHSWVQICQKVTFNNAGGLADQIMNATQATTTNSKLNGTPTSNVRKHQHQRSMGNFLQVTKNNTPQLQNSKHKTLLNTIVQTQTFHNTQISKQDQIKKHRRNITQPNVEFLQKQYDKSSANGKRSQFNFDSLQTQANTPYATTQIEAARILAGITKSKKKQKCKTNMDDDFVKPQKYTATKKSYGAFDDIDLGKKTKHVMQTETGPMIAINGSSKHIGHLGHTRNFSSIQLKQNDKIKKKNKPQDKQEKSANPKLKKIEEQLTQISGKFSIEKSKEKERLMVS